MVLNHSFSGEVINQITTRFPANEDWNDLDMPDIATQSSKFKVKCLFIDLSKQPPLHCVGALLSGLCTQLIVYGAIFFFKNSDE